MKKVNEDLKIKIILKNKGNLLANANISIYTTLYDFITVKGFQIWISNVYNSRLSENINIQPPGRLVHGNFYKMLFLEKKEKWYELEMEIYLAYSDLLNTKKDVIEPEDILI